MKLNLAKYPWQLEEPVTAPEGLREELCEAGLELSPAFLHLLLVRGYDSLEKIKSAINPEPQLFHSPWLLHDMERAVDRIQQAVADYEPILVYGDYDADGITSTLIVLEALEMVGAQVIYYLPNRYEDGYGPNIDRYREFIDQGIKLIITVDNGVAGHEAIAFAQEQGVDVIVTDHHELQDSLPEAYAIIHPCHPAGDYPFHDLAGAGVALKLVTALLDELPVEAIELAAIGTVSDLVSLKDENRTIVFSGLNLLRQTQRIGLQLLLTDAGVKMTNLNEETIGFVIGPRLNAVGRMGDPSPGLELLRSFDEYEAQAQLQLINQANDDRRSLVDQIFAKIQTELDSVTDLPDVIILADPQWSSGVLGIVASRVVDIYQRPTLLFEYQADSETYRGSGRSTDHFNLFEFLQGQTQYLKAFGGHAQAAGMTVAASEWQAFQDSALAAAAEERDSILALSPLKIDLTLKSGQVTVDLIEEFQRLAPFGMGNPAPRVLLEDVTLSDVKRIGRNQDHLKLQGSNDADQPHPLEMIGFSMADRARGITVGQKLTVVGQLSLNHWQDRVTPQLQLADLGVNGPLWIDIRRSQVPEGIYGIEDGLFLVHHQQIRDLFQARIPSSSRVLRYRDCHHESSHAEGQQLVIVEPPLDLDLLGQVLDSGDFQRIYLGSYVQESRYLAGLPTRQDCALVYTWLAQQEPFKLRQQLSAISQQLQLPVTKLTTVFLMFLEAGFVTIEDGIVTMVPKDAQQTVDLFSLSAYRSYEQAMQAEALLNYQPIQTIAAYFEAK